MATGIAQKSCKALFPLWPPQKKNILESGSGKIESIGKNSDTETKK